MRERNERVWERIKVWYNLRESKIEKEKKDRKVEEDKIRENCACLHSEYVISDKTLCPRECSLSLKQKQTFHRLC